MKSTIHQHVQTALLFLIALLFNACSEWLPWQDENDPQCPNTCSSEEVIIGCDDRSVRPEDVDSTTEEPWSFIGKLYPNGCTGTLIADRFVLTAAHCIYNVGRTQMGFALAQTANNKNRRPFGTHGVQRIYVPVHFENNNDELDRAYDLAIVELREPIEGATPAKWGYVGLSVLRSKPVFTAGYPGAQPDGLTVGRPWITDGIYYSEQPFNLIDNGASSLLYTDMDGTGGQSGSPAYSLLTPSQHNDGPGIIRKVHGVLIGSPEVACMSDQNWIARLTPEIVAHIQNAMLPLANDPFWVVTELQNSPTVDTNQDWP